MQCPTGDDQLEADFEERCQHYNPLHYWEHVHPYNLQVLSAKSWVTQPQPEAEPHESRGERPTIRKNREQGRPTRRTGKTVGHAIEEERAATLNSDPLEVNSQISSPPRNPYEGDRMAKQLSESLEDYLNRLKPSKTTTEAGPWIWIANPRTSNQNMYRNQPRFVDEGNGLLDVYMSRKRKLEEQNPDLAPATITRRLKPEREWLEESLSDMAKKCSVTNGKWMLFPMPQRVDEIWAVVAKGTLEGRLGSAAKVATDAGDGKPERLICIYTEDFSDIRDVMRVLKEMRRLGLVSSEKGAKPIYYKTDAYTYLGITSDNDYKLKASKYCSRDLLTEMDKEPL